MKSATWGQNVKNEYESEKTASHRNGWAASVSSFAMGLGLGAALGMLLAPRSGEDTRDYLLANGKAGVDAVVTAGQKLTRRAQQGVDRAKDRLNQAQEVGEQAFREAKNSSS
jgi:gas vesicle protein